MANFKMGIGLLLALILQTLPGCVWAGNGFKAMAKEFSYQASKRGIQRMAVLPFAPVDGSSHARGRFLSEHLASYIARSGKVNVVERAMMKEIMQEHFLGQTGVLDQRHLAQVGRMLQAQAVVIGFFYSFGNKAEISARLVNIETGAILDAGEAQVKGDWMLALDGLFPSPSPITPEQVMAEERCENAAARVDALEESVLSLKARHWGQQLKKKKISIEQAQAAGAIVSNPELRGKYYEYLKLASVQPQPLSPMEVARFVNADGQAFTLHQKCKTDAEYIAKR